MFVLTACAKMAPGQLYTNVIRPYSMDFHDTTVGAKRCVFDEYSVKEPVSGYNISVEWRAENIKTAARKGGIKRITCIDEQTFSVLFGIYKRKRLIIYGD